MGNQVVDAFVRPCFICFNFSWTSDLLLYNIMSLTPGSTEIKKKMA